MREETQYLLVVYALERRAGGPVSPGQVADALGRSPSATTEMLQRLDDRGLLAVEPYDGATLTAEGRERAEERYETYATLSRFFRDVLGIADYAEEALSLAGSVSPTVADRLAATLLESEPTDTAPADPPLPGIDGER